MSQAILDDASKIAIQRADQDQRDASLEDWSRSRVMQATVHTSRRELRPKTATSRHARNRYLQVCGMKYAGWCVIVRWTSRIKDGKGMLVIDRFRTICFRSFDTTFSAADEHAML